MMTQRSLALLGFLCAPQVARVSVWAQSRGTPVVIGETIQLQSNTLKESRSLLISKPAGYDSGMERYPVLYLLDAETHFHYASGLADFLAKDDRMPNMLFVGIVSGEHTPAFLDSERTDPLRQLRPQRLFNFRRSAIPGRHRSRPRSDGDRPGIKE